jgi:biotin operon repressor
LLIDASLIVFSLAVVNAHLQNESTVKQWLLVGLYTIGTVTFNVLHAPDNLQSQVVAAIAPISLFFSFELLMSQLKSTVQKYGLTLSVSQLDELLDTRQQEVDTRQGELDKLLGKIEQAQVELEQLKADKKVLNSVDLDAILRAQQARLAQVEKDRQARLDALVNTLKSSPDTKVSTLADNLQVSRTTIYNDLSTLEQQGVIHKNGNGWKVSR